MHLNPENTADWIATIEPDLAASGYTVEDIIHDHAYRCDACEEKFTSADDLDDDNFCEDCAANSYDASWAGMRREHGTWG